MDSPSTFYDGMRTRLPPNVHRETNRHGKPVFYYRVGKGPRVRLPSYGSEDFDPAYQAALRGEAPPTPTRGARAARQGTVAWVIGEYRQSLHFRGLDPVTQRRRESFFRQMIEKSGDRLIGQVTEQRIIDSREKLTHGKGHAANNFLKAIKPMFAYAKARGWIEMDPARNVDFVKPMKGGRVPWTVEDYQRFERRFPLGTMENLALRILLFTGFRRSDAAIFGEQHIKDDRVRFRPGKTSKSSEVIVDFTLLPPLKEAIQATEPIRIKARVRNPAMPLAFLLTEHGRPFASGASFGNWFEERCIAAKVAGRAHGLRKLGPTLAAEWGATAHELMAMWGWTTLAQAELYTRAANRQVLGDSAAAKLMAGFADSAQKANAIPRTLDEGAGMQRKAE